MRIKSIMAALLLFVAGLQTAHADHEWVDLGLPSGTLWATCNVGANSPEGYGNYYAWGETTTKSNYTENTYTYQLPTGATELEPSADAATVNWGSEWQMPSAAQFDELINNQYTTIEKVYDEDDEEFTGYQITSKSNGKSIFLPYAGCKYGTTIYGDGSYHSCFYWSRTIGSDDSYGFCLMGSFSGLYVGDNFMPRSYGATVRPVRIPKLVTSIELSETSLTLYPGESKTLTATVLPEDADNKEVTWSSSNTGVATVDKTGKVTAVASGTCTISCTATDGSGVKAECQVEVIEDGTGERVLKILLADGQVVAIRLSEEPRTTYQDGNLVITTNNNSVTYPLEMVKRFTYVYMNDYIDAIKMIEAEFSNDGETLTFSKLKPHTKIALYNIAGQLLKTFDNAEDSKIVISVSHFPTGVYIVKVNGGTYKIMKR